MKGAAGQIDVANEDLSNPSQTVGFKCSAYSVLESAGTVKVKIIRSEAAGNGAITFGWRTQDGEGEAAAKAPKDYEACCVDSVTMEAG